jgi:ABC-type bacteriocin/lantibiotic exporter with double-glycine peptidase domain
MTRAKLGARWLGLFARFEQRRWLAHEVVQTSAMDCGPATLKSLLEGFGVSASYGRLREACQTDVDGTSIDALEDVARQLGLDAEQVLIPIDHALLKAGQNLPAIAVVKLPGGASHFIVIWRRVGPWVQVMDPAAGRQWLRVSTMLGQLLVHRMNVPLQDWRTWALSADFAAPMLARLVQLGLNHNEAHKMLTQAQAHHHWFGLGALDACTRFVQDIINNGGLTHGHRAAALAGSLFAQTLAAPDDIYCTVPMSYWSVVPQAIGGEGMALRMQGVVMVRVKGLIPADNNDALCNTKPASINRELSAALAEPPMRPLRTAWQLLGQAGRLTPLAVLGVSLVAAAAVLMEMLLFRGLLDTAGTLGDAMQRLMALLMLLAFGVILLGLEWPVMREAMRLGRQLEARLRMALLDKLPRLSERYFQSRAVSDMAERSHSIHATRNLPGLALQCVRTVADLGMTLLGLAWIDPACLRWAVPMVLTALALPWLWRPWMSERDMRVRNQASALHTFCLDALLGLTPIRTHGAERAVRQEHEGLLVGWTRSTLSLVRVGLLTEGIQSALMLGMACMLLWGHFQRNDGATGADLLLIYWVLKLPALGQWLVSLAQQISAQRNVLARLIEPLQAPQDEHVDVAPNEALSSAPTKATSAAQDHAGPTGLAWRIDQGEVRAAGHTLLADINLRVTSGEHIAIVGPSGAGKSTLAALLLGLHRLSEGQLHIEGHPPSPQMPKHLRAHTAWIDPATQIWNRSLLDNLHSALPDGHTPELGPAMEAAHLRSVLQKLPQGLQTHLGEGGALLSGGEGQRVRLARALLQSDVRLALLDEPFRGLDRTQRQILLRELRQWWSGATLLCVTHDVSETQGFDRVLVIENGRIVEDDSPAALVPSPLTSPSTEPTPSRYQAMLQAEQAVHAELWQQPTWRRLHLSAQELQG